MPVDEVVVVVVAVVVPSLVVTVVCLVPVLVCVSIELFVEGRKHICNGLSVVLCVAVMVGRPQDQLFTPAFQNDDLPPSKTRPASQIHTARGTVQADAINFGQHPPHRGKPSDKADPPPRPIHRGGVLLRNAEQLSGT